MFLSIFIAKVWNSTTICQSTNLPIMHMAQALSFVTYQRLLFWRQEKKKSISWKWLFIGIQKYIVSSQEETFCLDTSNQDNSRGNFFIFPNWIQWKDTVYTEPGMWVQTQLFRSHLLYLIARFTLCISLEFGWQGILSWPGWRSLW